MRYALVSDIHANLLAWNAVYADIRRMDVDAIICLGDTVGYGPRPGAVMERMHAAVHSFVLGNHDAVICGKLSDACFNPDAQFCVAWTREHLATSAAGFFRGLPHMLTGPGFCCTHGDPAAPSRFRYVIEPKDALRVWSARPEPLCLVGHTHVPGLFVLGDGGTPHWLTPRDFAVEDGKRYVVNVGSVGQPRDGDVRAAYCLFDSDTGTVSFRRIPFDLDAFREQLVAAGLPTRPHRFLQRAAERQPPPLREYLPFRPPAAEPAAGTESFEVRELKAAVRTASRWRRLALWLLVVLGALPAVALIRCRARSPDGITITARDGPAPLPAPATVGMECLTMPVATGPVTRRNQLRQWTVQLAAPKTPLIAAEARAGLPVFRVTSAAAATFAIRAAPLRARPGMRFTVAADFYVPRPLSGHLELELRQRLEDGTEIVLLQHPVLPLPTGQWSRRARTMPRGRHGLRRSGTVHWVLKGRFTGELLVRECSLLYREMHKRP